MILRTAYWLNMKRWFLTVNSAIKCASMVYSPLPEDNIRLMEVLPFSISVVFPRYFTMQEFNYWPSGDDGLFSSLCLLLLPPLLLLLHELPIYFHFAQLNLGEWVVDPNGRGRERDIRGRAGSLWERQESSTGAPYTSFSMGLPSLTRSVAGRPCCTRELCYPFSCWVCAILMTYQTT